MEILELEIEKVIYEGLGLARYDGMAVFVKGVLDGEVVKAKILSKNKNYIKAELVEIIKPSEHRIKPFCPMSKPCGGCDFGFMDYDYSTLIKQKITEEIFSEFNNLEIKEIVKSPNHLEYRAKTQYPVTETKNSKRILAGYYKEGTHELVNIKFCPIQPSIVDEIVEFTRENWKLGAYLEKKHQGLLRHINTRVSEEKVLLCLVLNADEKEFEKNKKEVEVFCDLIMEKFPQITGVTVNLNPIKTNKITGDKTILIKGEGHLLQNLKNSVFKIGVNSFFQVNPKCAQKLFDCAIDLIKKKGTLLDLYGGVGTIGIYLKDYVTKITLVEENKEAISLAKENYKLNKVEKYEIFEGRANSIIENFIKEKKKFENIIIDPPRKGSDKVTLNNISKMTNSIIYISCNPMTLRRDAKILIENGFVFKSAQAVDMFPNTHHIEVVAHFEKGAL